MFILGQKFSENSYPRTNYPIGQKISVTGPMWSVYEVGTYHLHWNE